MRLFTWLLLPLMIVISQGYGESTACKEIANYIFENLPEYGTLEQDENGFVYVDLDDDYIFELVEFIRPDGFKEPPYFGRAGSHGAHISVMYAGELNQMVAEVGKVIYFKRKACKIAQPLHTPGVEAIYLIEVEAPYLDKLRKRYGLAKRRFDYHITIGVKKK